MSRTPSVTLWCAALLAATATTSAAAAAAGQIQVPAEVVVSSDTAFVKGNNRADRLLTGNAKKGITVVGDDGVPVVYGVRVHETEEERNEPMWRNARVIGNKLFRNDEAPPPLPAPPQATALESKPATETASSVRQGRILSYSSGAQFGFNRVKTTTQPPFNYQSYYGSKQRPTAATANSGYQYSGHSKGQGLNVVQAPSVATPTRRSSSNRYPGFNRQSGGYTTTPREPEVTTTVPVYQAFFDTNFNEPVRRQSSKPEHSYSPERRLQYSYSPSTQSDVYYSADPQAPTASYPGNSAQADVSHGNQAQTGFGPFQRPTNTRQQHGSQPQHGSQFEHGSQFKQGSQFEHRFQSVPSKSSGGFRFPSSSSGSATERPAGQILSPGSYNLPQAAADFQDTVDPFSGRPVNPDQFKIKQMAFQSIPGGPIVNIPVPIPNGQQTKKPVLRKKRPFSFLSNLFGSTSRKDRFPGSPTQASAPSAPASTAPAYYNNDPYLYDENGFRKPTLYDTITDPIRKLGENVIEFTRPVTQPFRDATDRLKEELGFSAPTDQPADKQAGGEEALLVGGLVAGAGALAGLSVLVYANTVDNNTHYIIGRRRRSLDEPGVTGLLENLVEAEDHLRAQFLERLRDEGFQRWSQGPCAKRIFCDFMTQQDSDTVTSVASRVTTFLS
ncbi:hypothetical protein FJT64_019695 [Amphibalanus amphitrite]|uniref:Uncharacterized protein n=1 Tax=Amphibalanus amphitrite TaxID=1232801 RepID=A0A6A4WQW5_AMPAM|nr:hypothetical protein FJT64_019695 [Amphibalanus amphitrite]